MRSSFFWDVTHRTLVVTVVSEQLIDPIFKGQAVQDDCVTVEDGTDRLSRNFGNYQSRLRNIPEERRSHIALKLYLRSNFALKQKLASIQ
jgi:hypothetical protein